MISFEVLAVTEMKSVRKAFKTFMRVNVKLSEKKSIPYFFESEVSLQICFCLLSSSSLVY